MPATKLEKISPQKATEYLAKNLCNRPISPPTVQKYVRLIQTGKFYVNPSIELKSHVANKGLINGTFQY